MIKGILYGCYNCRNFEGDIEVDKKLPVIDIEGITENRQYAQVAFLVDREDFLTDVYKAREDLVPKGLVKYELVPGWEAREGIGNTTIKDIWLAVFETFPYIKKSDRIAETLRRKYKKTPNFFRAIKYVILCGKVTDEEFSTAYAALIGGTKYLPKLANLIYPSRQLPEIGIIVTPETTWQEVRRAYKTQMPFLRSIYEKEILKPEGVLSDTFSGVKNHRKWYWLNKAGRKDRLGYEKIFALVKQEANITSLDTIRRGIQAYTKQLAAQP